MCCVALDNAQKIKAKGTQACTYYCGNVGQSPDLEGGWILPPGNPVASAEGVRVHSVTRITTQCLSGQEALIDRPFPFLMSK